MKRLTVDLRAHRAHVPTQQRRLHQEAKADCEVNYANRSGQSSADRCTASILRARAFQRSQQLIGDVRQLVQEAHGEFDQFIVGRRLE